jgi:hypothetical protein
MPGSMDQSGSGSSHATTWAWATLQLAIHELQYVLQDIIINEIISICWKSSLYHPDCCCLSLVITPGTLPRMMYALDRIVVPKIKTKIVLTVGDYFKRVSYFSNFSNAVWLLAIP